MPELTAIVDSEVITAYATYVVIVVLKMMLMAPLTSYYRMKKKVRGCYHSSGALITYDL